MPLTEAQVHAITATEQPLRLIDPQTNSEFVLIRAEEYENLLAQAGDGYDIRETYAAQFASAMRAGWADPEMDEYDNYDEVYRKRCQPNEGT